MEMKIAASLNTYLRVDISELRERSSLRIAKELGNGFDIGGGLVFGLGPGVELGIWREARVEVVDPSDIVLRKLLENGTLRQGISDKSDIVLSMSMGSTGCYVCPRSRQNEKSKIHEWGIALDRDYLLGSVGPGTSANHLSKMTKFSAIKLYTGMRAVEAKVILSPARVRLVVPMAVSCSWRNPFIVSCSISLPCGKLSSG